MEPIVISLVDDHRVVRRGLRAFFESVPGFRIAWEAASAEEALTLLESQPPDVTVMDLVMPGGMGGLEATRRFRAISPHTQVVVLTAHNDEARLLGALRAGAIGYVGKDAEPEFLLTAVRAAARGQASIDPAMAGMLLAEISKEIKTDGSDLTNREQEVLRLLAVGKTNKEIADLLVVGEETVKTHVGNVLAKLHLSHRSQAILYAIKKGVITSEDIDL